MKKKKTNSAGFVVEVFNRYSFYFFLSWEEVVKRKTHFRSRIVPASVAICVKISAYITHKGQLNIFCG
jgi:hypothetical protein